MKGKKLKYFFKGPAASKEKLFPIAIIGLLILSSLGMMSFDIDNKEKIRLDDGRTVEVQLAGAGPLSWWGDDGSGEDHPDAAVPSFSGTLISDYKYNWQIIFDLDDLPKETLMAQYNTAKSWLTNEGWTERYCDLDKNVKLNDFKSDLDKSSFHYHCGHGVYHPGKRITQICLHDFFLGIIGEVNAGHVAYEWDNKCKWVFLHSCHLLEAENHRDDWSRSLDKCHILMGFASISYLSTEVVDKFFEYAIDNDINVVGSYYLATKDAYWPEVKASALADTEAQWESDHLYGQGTVQPDEEPNDNTYYYNVWEC